MVATYCAMGIVRSIGRVLCVAAVGGLFAGEVGAMWARMSLEQLVQQSDLVVVGELVAVNPEPGGRFDIGRLRVDEVIMGQKDVAEVALAVPALAGGLRSSEAIYYNPGRRGLWFLRRQPGTGAQSGVYLADHPQRLQPVENVSEVRAYLETGPKR